MRGCIALAALALSAVAHADITSFTLTEGGASFTQNVQPSSTIYGPVHSGSFQTANSLDYLGAHGWYYRLEGDTQEYAFPGSASVTQNGPNEATLSFEDRGIRFDLTYVLTEESAERAWLNIHFFVTNTGDVANTVDFFWYGRYSIVYMDDMYYNNGVMSVAGFYDPFTYAKIYATLPDQVGWKIDDPVVMLSIFGDSSPTDLDNKDGDYYEGGAGSFQWSRILDPGESFSGTVTEELYHREIIPEPASLLTLGFGGAALAFRSMRRGRERRSSRRSPQA